MGGAVVPNFQGVGTPVNSRVSVIQPWLSENCVVVAKFKHVEVLLVQLEIADLDQSAVDRSVQLGLGPVRKEDDFVQGGNDQLDVKVVLFSEGAT